MDAKDHRARQCQIPEGQAMPSGPGNAIWAVIGNGSKAIKCHTWPSRPASPIDNDRKEPPFLIESSYYSSIVKYSAPFFVIPVFNSLS